MSQILNAVACNDTRRCKTLLVNMLPICRHTVSQTHSCALQEHMKYVICYGQLCET